MFFHLLEAALVALVAWRLFRRRRPPEELPDRSTTWRFVPLGAGLSVLSLAVLTWGAGVVLAPLAFLLTLFAVRRMGRQRGLAFWVGAGLNVWLMFLFLVTLGVVIHDALAA